MNGKTFRRQARHVVVLWLVLLFCVALHLRFTRTAGGSHNSELFETISISERLTVVALYSDGLPEELKSGMLDAAEALESNPAALLVIRDTFQEPSARFDLTPIYSLLVEDRLHPSSETTSALREIARHSRARFTLSAALLATIVLGSFILLVTPAKEANLPISPTELGPMGILTLFLVWDSLGFYGIALAIQPLINRIDPFILILFSQLLLYGLLLVLFKLFGNWSGGNPFKRFSPTWIGRGYFLCVISVLSVNLLLTKLWGVSPQSENPVLSLFIDASSAKLALLAALVVFIGPFFEELLFRGWLLGGLRHHWGDTRALLASSLLFTLIHGDTTGFAPLFLLSTVFGWLYLRTGSLWPSFLVHSLWNATTFSFLLLLMP